MAVFTYGRTLGAMRAQVNGGVKDGFLPHPNTVFHHGINGATHRAVGTNGAFNLDLARPHVGNTWRRLGFLHQAQL